MVFGLDMHGWQCRIFSLSLSHTLTQSLTLTLQVDIGRGNKNPCLGGSQGRVVRLSVWLDNVSCDSCEIRYYATFNFVNDSFSQPKESIPSSVPVERIRTEKPSRKKNKQMEKPQHELTSTRHGSPLDNLHAKKPPRQQSPNWKFSGSKNPSKDEDDFAELGEPLILNGDAGAIFVNKTQEASLRVESMKRALVAQHVTIGNFHLPVRGLQTAKVVTVRISSICPETTEPSIHSVCMRYGSVVGLTRKKDGAVEILFSIQYPIGAEDIVKKLNNVSIDNCKWSAQLLSENLPSTADVDDVKCGIESQIMCLIRDFKKHIEMKKIYLEDLEELHQSVVHMTGCPSASDL